MTEREAWLYCADEFENYQYIEALNECGSKTGKHGICAVLSDLHSKGEIRATQYYEMDSAISALPNVIGGYKWKWSKEDMKARAKFCREQAKSARN